MSWWNRIEYPVDKIRSWIADGKTQKWVGQQLNVSPKLVYKVCKKYKIPCQRTGPRSGQGHPNWKGGRVTDKHGYVLAYAPDHPFARKPRKKYVLLHRLLMEQHLNRFLLPQEVVHHKNRDKQDNRIENLTLFSKNSAHLKHELTGKCPNWSAQGKKKLRWCSQQFLLWNANHRKLKPCGLMNK